MMENMNTDTEKLTVGKPLPFEKLSTENQNRIYQWAQTHLSAKSNFFCGLPKSCPYDLLENLPSIRDLIAIDLNVIDFKLKTYDRNWSDPLGVSAWMNREAKYYTVEALNLVTYFLDGAIDALMWLMETTDELSNKLDKGS